MPRKYVVSSNLKWVDYDFDNHILTIGFRSGSVYEYYDVPEEIYWELLEADSKGRYFWRYIRNDFEYRRIR